MLKLTVIVQGENVCRNMFRQLKDGASETFGFCTTPCLKPKTATKQDCQTAVISKKHINIGNILAVILHSSLQNSELHIISD